MAVSSTSGQGRPKGVPNKATADIKALARIHAPSVIERLAHLALNADSETAQIAAGKELLDRGFGKAAQPQTGSDGEGPVVTEVLYRWAQPEKE